MTKSLETKSWNVRELRRALADGTVRPTELAEQALARSNQNAGRNTYLWQDADWTRAEARRAESICAAMAVRSAMGVAPYGACRCR